MDESNDEKPKGWPVKRITSDDIPYWLKCLLILIAAVLVVFLVPALVGGILYLSSDILSAYVTGTDSSSIRSSILLLSALLGSVGVPLFIWRTIIAAQQSETARDRSYTELFTKAVEQLGAEKPAKRIVEGIDGDPTTVDDFVPNIEVRIGAIFALERIMNDSEKDAPAIVDTLAAYVRENCGKPTLECKIPEQEGDQSTADWMKAIADYVGDRWQPDDGTLHARAKALKENLIVNRSDIKTALTVLGRRPLHLKDPKNFESSKTKRPDLRAVNFQGWDLSGFDLSYCDLTNAKMQGADLTYAKMQGADISIAKIQGANLFGAKMQGADLSYTNMQCADISFTEMQDASLLDANMQGADLTFANMQGADISFTEMQGSNLSEAEMQGVNLRHVKMQDVQITSARKAAASVIWFDFTETKFEMDTLQEQLLEMFGHQNNTITTLPENMDRPEHWSIADLDTTEGYEQYNREWEAFKKKMGVE